MNYRPKSVLVLSVLAILLSTSPVSANVYQERESVDQKLKTQEASLGHIKGEVKTLEGQLAALDQSINALTTRIAENSADINRVEADIAKQEALLVERKEQRNQLIRTSYIQSRTTALEMIVGSRSLSDYFSRAQYREDTEQKVTEAAEQLAQTKARLSQQKTTLVTTRQQLDGNRQAVKTEKTKQAELLATTQGEESQFQKLVEETKSQKASIDSEIAELSRQAAIRQAAAERAEKLAQQRAAEAAKAAKAARPAAAAAPAAPAPAPAPKPQVQDTGSGSIKRGQIIGYEGTTGNSTGCHLHFTVYQNGKEVNPAFLISSGILGRPENYGPRNVTQNFGPAAWPSPWYSFHNGMDISTGCGSPVYAASDGDIIKNVSNDGSGYGHYIVINHHNGLVTLYAHLQY